MPSLCAAYELPGEDVAEGMHVWREARGVLSVEDVLQKRRVAHLIAASSHSNVLHARARLELTHVDAVSTPEAQCDGLEEVGHHGEADQRLHLRLQNEVEARTSGAVCGRSIW